MKAFFGGQIKAEQRGDLAAVISREGDGKYGVFLYHTNSDEFYYLTGIMSTKITTERVYIGISGKCGEHVTDKGVRLSRGELSLEDIDAEFVYSYFLTHT